MTTQSWRRYLEVGTEDNMRGKKLRSILGNGVLRPQPNTHPESSKDFSRQGVWGLTQEETLKGAVKAPLEKGKISFLRRGGTPLQRRGEMEKISRGGNGLRGPWGAA